MEGILDYTDITNDIKRYYGDQEGVKTIVLRYMDSVTGDILLTIERDAILGEKFEFTLPRQFEKDGIIYECLCKETQISQCIFEDIDATFAFTPQAKTVKVTYIYKESVILTLEFEIYKSYKDVDLCAPFLGLTDNPTHYYMSGDRATNLRYDIDYKNPRDIVVTITGYDAPGTNYFDRFISNLYSTDNNGKLFPECLNYGHYAFEKDPGEYTEQDMLKAFMDGGVYIDSQKELHNQGRLSVIEDILTMGPCLHEGKWTGKDVSNNYDRNVFTTSPNPYFFAAEKHFVVDKHCLEENEFFTEVDTPAGKQMIQIKPIPIQFILHDTPEELIYNELNITVMRKPTTYKINMVLPDKTVVFTDTVEIYEDTVYTTPEVPKTIKGKMYKYQHFKYDEQYETLNLTWFMKAGTSKNQTINIPVEQMPTEYKLDYLACCLDHNGEIWDTHLIGSEWLSIMEDTEHPCSKVLELFKNADKHIAEFADGNIPSEPLEYDVQNWYDNPIIKTVNFELLPTIWNVQFIDTDHTAYEYYSSIKYGLIQAGDAEPLMYEVPYNFYVYCWEDERELDAEIIKKFLIQTLEGEDYPEYLKIKDLDEKYKLAWEADGEDIKHGTIEVEVERIPTYQMIVYYSTMDKKVLYTEEHPEHPKEGAWEFYTDIVYGIKHDWDTEYWPDAVLKYKQHDVPGDLTKDIVKIEGKIVYDNTKAYYCTEFGTDKTIRTYMDLFNANSMYSHIVSIPCTLPRTKFSLYNGLYKDSVVEEYIVDEGDSITVDIGVDPKSTYMMHWLEMNNPKYIAWELYEDDDLVEVYSRAKGDSMPTKITLNANERSASIIYLKPIAVSKIEYDVVYKNNNTVFNIKNPLHVTLENPTDVEQYVEIPKLLKDLIYVGNDGKEYKGVVKGTYSGVHVTRFWDITEKEIALGYPEYSELVTSTYKVHFKDEEGNTIADDVTVSVKNNDYTYIVPALDEDIYEKPSDSIVLEWKADWSNDATAEAPINTNYEVTITYKDIRQYTIFEYDDGTVYSFRAGDTLGYSTVRTPYSGAPTIDHLKKVTIGNTVKTIGYNAFGRYYISESKNYKYCSVEEVIAPYDSVVSVKDKAFMYCKNLHRLQLGNSVEETGDSAFAYDALDEYVDTENWKISRGSLHLCFRYCNIKEITLGNWPLSDVTNMSCVFANNPNLTRIDVSNINTSNITDLGGVFMQDTNLEEVIGIESLDTSNATILQDMFLNCSKIKRVDISKWDTSKVTSMSGMFKSCIELECVGNLDKLDVGNVKNFSWLFYHDEKLNGIGLLSDWDTHSATDMSYMFSGCGSIEELDLTNWDMSNVTNIEAMFWGNFHPNVYDANRMHLRSVGDISGWNVSKLQSGTNAFTWCYVNLSFPDHMFDNWDLRALENIIIGRGANGFMYVKDCGDISIMNRPTGTEHGFYVGKFNSRFFWDNKFHSEVTDLDLTQWTGNGKNELVWGHYKVIAKMAIQELYIPLIENYNSWYGPTFGDLPYLEKLYLPNAKTFSYASLSYFYDSLYDYDLKGFPYINDKLKMLFLPSISTANTVGISACRNLETVDIGPNLSKVENTTGNDDHCITHNNSRSSSGDYYKNFKNLILRCENVFDIKLGTVNQHQLLYTLYGNDFRNTEQQMIDYAKENLRVFVPASQVDNYKNDSTWGMIAESIVPIGGTDWVERFGSNDVYANLDHYGWDRSKALPQ